MDIAELQRMEKPISQQEGQGMGSERRRGVQDRTGQVKGKKVHEDTQ